MKEFTLLFFGLSVGLANAQVLMPVDWVRDFPGYSQITYAAAGKYVHVGATGGSELDASYVRLSGSGTASNAFTHHHFHVPWTSELFVHSADASGGAVVSVSQYYDDYGHSYRYYTGGYVGANGTVGGYPFLTFEYPAKFTESVVVGDKIRVAMTAPYDEEIAADQNFPLMRSYDPKGLVPPVNFLFYDWDQYPVAIDYSHTGNMACVYQNGSLAEYLGTPTKYFLEQYNLANERIVFLPLAANNIPNDICAYPVSAEKKNDAQYVVLAGNGFVRKLNPDGTTAFTRSTPGYDYKNIDWVPNVGLVAKREGFVNGQTVVEIAYFTEQNITRKVTLPPGTPWYTWYRVDDTGQLFAWHHGINGYMTFHAYPAPGVRKTYDLGGDPVMDDFNNVYFRTGATSLGVSQNLQPLGYDRITLKGGGTARVYLNLRFGATRNLRTVTVDSSGSSNIQVPTRAEFAPGGTAANFRITSTPVTIAEKRMVEIKFGGRALKLRVDVLP